MFDNPELCEAVKDNIMIFGELDGVWSKCELWLFNNSNRGRTDTACAESGL